MHAVEQVIGGAATFSAAIFQYGQEPYFESRTGHNIYFINFVSLSEYFQRWTALAGRQFRHTFDFQNPTHHPFSRPRLGAAYSQWASITHAVYDSKACICIVEQQFCFLIPFEEAHP